MKARCWALTLIHLALVLFWGLPINAEVKLLSHETTTFPQYGVYLEHGGDELNDARVEFSKAPDDEVLEAIDRLREENGDEEVERDQEQPAREKGDENNERDTGDLPPMPKPAPTHSAAAKVLSFEDQRDDDESVLVVFLVDTTESMSGEPLERVRQGVRAISRELRKQDRVAVVRFGEESDLVLAPTPDPAKAYRAVEQLEIWPRRKTKIFDALSETIQGNTHKEIARKSPVPTLTGRYFVVVFSDGLDRGSFLKADDLKGTIADQNPRPIVMTVGVSRQSAAHKDLKRVAHFAGNPDNFFDNPDPSALQRAFKASLETARGQALVTFDVPHWYWEKGVHKAELAFKVGGRKQTIPLEVKLSPSEADLKTSKQWREDVDAVVQWSEDQDSAQQLLIYGCAGGAFLLVLGCIVVAAVFTSKRAARRKAQAFNEIKDQIKDQDERTRQREQAREARNKEELRQVKEQSRVPLGVLICLSGPMKGQRFGLMNANCIIGREMDQCDLVFPSDEERGDLRISRVHARFERAGAEWNVTCLSSQGMTAAGRRVNNGETYPVRFGDRIEMGDSVFDFTAP